MPDLLSLGEAATVLGVPEITARRWALQGKLPIRQVDGRPHVERAELERWAEIHRLVIQKARSAIAPADRPADLIDAVDRGGVHFGVSGRDAGEVLRAVVGLAPLLPGASREELLDRVLEREAMASTAMGSGIAIPHPRAPAAGFVEQATVVVGFLDKPVDFGALDRQPVFVVFLLLNPSTPIHLRILARLGHLFRSPGFVEGLARCDTADGLHELVARAAREPGH